MSDMNQYVIVVDARWSGLRGTWHTREHAAELGLQASERLIASTAPAGTVVQDMHKAAKNLNASGVRIYPCACVKP